jgi:hypothetical protein
MTNLKADVQAILAKQITQWLTDPTMRCFLDRVNNKTLAETNFDLLIRWYPQVAFNGRDSYGLDIIGRLENAFVSQEAKNKLNMLCKQHSGSLSELKKELKKSVHYEHNCPVDVIKHRLLGLDSNSITFETVTAVLEEGYAIVLISKEEEYQLREKKLSKKGAFETRLKAIGAKLLDNTQKQVLIQDIKDTTALLK